ncbi:hypothetical protein IVA95_23440 [Bradyrhizobium sp. 157]|uniref:hypothetical protein n=1 Tax=Bradyrhizobium sp. 157 TaxID=2782631 RepID=UPI001FF70774|nr:hypothetical protein [Bradyrhizobium sp. 157]MCK1640456.1 hypothetical protein [Bradyrhizobium sp. 157]
MASWRKFKATQYPNDPRNPRAAETLARLAREGENLSDDDWAQLKPHYDWASEQWQEASDQAARLVEFRRDVIDFDGFVLMLRNLLEVQVAA